MNRTFYAFAMLLSLLVFATWAVNSGQRTTTVSAARTSGLKRLPASRHPGGSAIIIALPAAESPSWRSRIHSVRGALAEPLVAAVATADPLDDRSPVENLAGEFVPDEPSRQRQNGPSTAANRPLTDVEIIQLFATLSRNPASQPLAVRIWPEVRSNLAFYARGLQQWSLWQLERLAFVRLVRGLLSPGTAASPPVSWNEYGILVEQCRPVAPTPRGAQVQFVATDTVQSGHWLLHSAASSLNRLAQLLALAADQLYQGDKLAQAALD